MDEEQILTESKYPPSLNKEQMKNLMFLSHDLNNKMLSLSLSTSLMFDNEPKSSDLPFAQNIQSTVDRSTEILKLMNKVLTEPALITKMNTQQVNMNAFCKAEFPKRYEEFRKIYGIDYTIDFVDSAPCDIVVDLEKAWRIDENLIENAIKAGATKIHLKLSCTNDSFKFEFSDNGKGMSAHELETLHLRMFNKGNHGIGTKYILDFIDQTNAFAYFTSEKGKGTTFHSIVHNALKGES